MLIDVDKWLIFFHSETGIFIQKIVIFFGGYFWGKEAGGKDALKTYRQVNDAIRAAEAYRKAFGLFSFLLLKQIDEEAEKIYKSKEKP